MNIQKIPIEKLNPAEYNPRKDLSPDDPEYQKILKSIELFDYVEPIVWNENTGNIISGHQRFKILKQKEYKEIDVSVVNLSQKKEKQLNIALNKIRGEWEYDKLADILRELDNTDFTGFDDDEIQNILKNQENILPEDILKKDIFEVVISCENETEQEKVYNKLKKEGYECRVLTL